MILLRGGGLRELNLVLEAEAERVQEGHRELIIILL